MQLRLSFIVLLFVIVFGTTFSVTAQSASDSASTRQVHYNSHTPSTAEWQSVTNDKDFGYRNMTEQDAKPEKTDEPGPISKMLNAIFKLFASTVGQFLIWTAIVIVVLYGAYKLVIGNGNFLFGKNSKKLSGTETSESQEEELLSVNWEHRLQQAIAAGDFRLAVRCSYMYLLRLMQERQLIDYRHDKTNYEYSHELENTKFKQPFRKLTRQYEYAWYGQYPLSQASFTEYLNEFQELKKQIGVS